MDDGAIPEHERTPGSGKRGSSFHQRVIKIEGDDIARLYGHGGQCGLHAGRRAQRRNDCQIARFEIVAEL
jgi:hypothetical protein